MTDQEQKKDSTNVTPQRDAENKKKEAELSEEELKKATGGLNFNKIQVTYTQQKDN